MIWPRPIADNGIGIHIGLNLTDRNIALDLDRCLDMGMSWAMICGEPNRAIVAAERFWAEGIMPVIRPYNLINEPFSWEDYTEQAADALGFPPYIQCYNEPGDDREYRRNRQPKDWLSFFAHKWHRVANKVAMAGGLPGLQVLSAEELRVVMDIGKLFHDGPFHEKAWFCPHNYGIKFPPDYYNEGKGKSIGALSFLDFAEVFNEKLGYVPPFICGEGGWFFGSIGNQTHARWTAEMYSWFRNGRLPILSNNSPSRMVTPSYLLAVCPWILSGAGCEPWHGWYTAARTVEAVKEMSDFVRQATPPPAWPDNARVVTDWMPEPAADLLRHDCEGAFGGKWSVEERDEE